MSIHTRAVSRLLTFLFVSALVSQGLAQAEIPGVTDIVQVACRDSTYFVKQVRAFQGTVEYRNDLKSYVISSAIPDVTYPPDTMVCGQWTGMVCNWPRLHNWIGKTITFSGRYFQARGVMPRYGGEYVFYLHVTALR